MWHHFGRLVSVLRPSLVVVENVASGATKWVDAICDDLAGQGYETLPVPLSAYDVGAPHLRRRIFVVAHANSYSQSTEPIDGEVAKLQGVAGYWDAANARQARLQGTEPTPRPESWQLAAGSAWATNTIPEPTFRRMDNGLASRMDRNHRLKALGNAVVPQCAEVIGHIIRDLAAPLPEPMTRVVQTG